MDYGPPNRPSDTNWRTPLWTAIVATVVGGLILTAVLAIIHAASSHTKQTNSSNTNSSNPGHDYSTPATGPSPTAPTSGSAGSPYALMYHRVLINMPPGNCADQTGVDFDYPNGPVVNPSTNLFNNSSNIDLIMDNCANPTQDQTLKSQASSISTDISHPVTAGTCLTAIEQRPDGTSVVPRSLMLQGNKLMCLQTSDGNIVLLEIKSLTTPPFQMQAYATAWNPNS